MKILSKLFKRTNKQIEDDDQSFTDEELELIRARADVEALNIYRQIYSLFKEHINELKEGYNLILLQEDPIKLCDDAVLNRSIKWESLNNYKKLSERIPELKIILGQEIKSLDGHILGFEKICMYTIHISHDNISEIYYIKFRVHPSPLQINNVNEIGITVYNVDKKIYKIV